LSTHYDKGVIVYVLAWLLTSLLSEPTDMQSVKTRRALKYRFGAIDVMIIFPEVRQLYFTFSSFLLFKNSI